jgi:hypothetical protein
MVDTKIWKKRFFRKKIKLKIFANIFRNLLLIVLMLLFFLHMKYIRVRICKKMKNYIFTVLYMHMPVFKRCLARILGNETFFRKNLRFLLILINLFLATELLTVFIYDMLLYICVMICKYIHSNCINQSSYSESNMVFVHKNGQSVA